MNILIDAHVFDEVHQGSRTYLKGVYSEMIPLLPDAHFFFAAYNPENLKVEFGEHRNVTYIQLKKKRFLRLLLEFPSIIRKHRIDYAHFTYVSPPIKNCKHIVSTHDILFRDFKDLFPLKYRVVKTFLFYVSAKRADILLTLSEFSRQRISKHFNIPSKEITITPCAVSNEFFAASSSDVTATKQKHGLDKYILYVSRIEPRKNHIILLRAFAQLRLWERGYKLVFVGKKDFLFHNIDEFIDMGPPGLKENTMHLLNVETKELAALYKGAALFVFPSLAEGFGIPPIEAILAGVPTLCSNKTSMSDFVFLGDDLFDPYNQQELEEKMLSKLSKPYDPAKAEKLKQMVNERYSWKGSAETIASLVSPG